MKHADPNHAPGFLQNGTGGWLKRILYRFRSWSEQRRAVGELAALSDRQLEDIGLTRVQVDGLTAGRLMLRDLQSQRRRDMPGTRRQTQRSARDEMKALFPANGDRTPETRRPSGRTRNARTVTHGDAPAGQHGVGGVTNMRSRSSLQYETERQ